MAIRNLGLLKRWFSKGEYPTGSQFADLLDSYRHKGDLLAIKDVDGLAATLNDKYDRTDADILEKKVDDTSIKVDDIGREVSEMYGLAQDVKAAAVNVQATANDVSTAATAAGNAADRAINTVNMVQSTAETMADWITVRFDGFADPEPDAVLTADREHASVQWLDARNYECRYYFSRKQQKFFRRLTDLDNGNVYWSDNWDAEPASESGETIPDSKFYENWDTIDDIRLFVDSYEGGVYRYNPQKNIFEGLAGEHQVLDDYLFSMGITCNPGTGLYTLNGLTDITYQQMLRIAALGRMSHTDTQQRYSNANCRTHLPRLPMYSVCIGTQTFYANRTIETVNIDLLMPADGTFAYCSALRDITVHSPNNNNRVFTNIFTGCTALAELRVSAVYPFDINLADSPLLSTASIQRIMDRYNSDKTITVTLHPDAYDRLTPEMKDFAATKNISLAQAMTVTP